MPRLPEGLGCCHERAKTKPLSPGCSPTEGRREMGKAVLRVMPWQWEVTGEA